MQLVSLRVSFEVEEEDVPDFPHLLGEIEMRLAAVDGVEFASADKAGATRRFDLVVEVEGDPDLHLAQQAILDALGERVKLVGDPQMGLPLVLEGGD